MKIDPFAAILVSTSILGLVFYKPISEAILNKAGEKDVKICIGVGATTLLGLALCDCYIIHEIATDLMKKNN
jgi:hypothetical protein